MDCVISTAGIEMRSYQLVKKEKLNKVNRARNSIYDRDEYTCQICGLNFKEKTDAKKNIDHIIPRSAIAWSHPFNLQLLCENCNAEKGSDIPTDFLEVIFKNTRKTARWFIDQSPTNDSKEEMLNYRNFRELIMESNWNIFTFDFERHYEVLALYYKDDYINSMTGIDLNDPDTGRLLQNTSWDNFLGEIKVAKEEMSDELSGKLWDSPGKSISTQKHNAKIMEGWLMALAMKLEIINENHLASKYRKMADRLKDVFRGGWGIF
jgi:hypothetical protein